MLVAVDSCNVLAYKKRLFGINGLSDICKRMNLPIIFYNRLLSTMIDDVCACECQIVKILPNNLPF